jgi:DNA-binding transcriptional regulator YiaG
MKRQNENMLSIDVDAGVSMRKIDFTESQIVEILREARVTPVPEVARSYNVTEATIRAWHGKFGQLSPEDVKRLRHLKTNHVKRQRLARQAANGAELTRSSPALHGTVKRTP